MSKAKQKSFLPANPSTESLKQIPTNSESKTKKVEQNILPNQRLTQCPTCQTTELSKPKPYHLRPQTNYQIFVSLLCEEVPSSSQTPNSE